MAVTQQVGRVNWRSLLQCRQTQFFSIKSDRPSFSTIDLTGPGGGLRFFFSSGALVFFKAAGGEKGVEEEVTVFSRDQSGCINLALPLPPRPPGASFRSFGSTLDQSMGTAAAAEPLLLVDLVFAAVGVSSLNGLDAIVNYTIAIAYLDQTYAGDST